MIGETISHYQIEEQLGQGGMGIVYRAVDTKLKREVALKFLPPQLSEDKDSKARFIQEAQAASGLDHPNICTIHEIGEAEDGRLFIAMSYYDGQTLKYLLGKGPMPPKQAGSIVAQIAEGLQKAHSAGIVHRDIKPANIMITNEGRVKILDFGVAKLGEGTGLTKAGSTVGTTAYMSPEQARGDSVDARTDLWSVGVILYELLSGERAFAGGYDQAVLYSVLNENPASLGDDVPKELAAIVERLVKKDPGERYESAQEVAEALEHWSGTRSVNVDAGTQAETANPRLIWAVPVGVLFIAVFLWLVLGRGSGTGDAEALDAHANVVAILPFSVQAGPEMEYLEEGMVSLLSTMLDGAGSIAVADHKAVIGNVQRRNDPVLDPSSGQEIAADFGASRFVLGSVIRAGVETRLNARLYSADGELENESEASFTGDEDFMAAVDALASGLVSGLITDVTEEMGSLAAGTTDSFEALKHYLNAESLLRQAEYDEGMEAIDLAIEIDSTFALAWYLKSTLMGWINVGEASAILRVAKRYKDRLPDRARNLLEGALALDDGRREEAIRFYRLLLKENPYDLEAAGGLAEILTHYGLRDSEKREALSLYKSISRLDPDNRRYVMHVVDFTAYEALRDNNYYALDSLAATLAEMPIPERGDSLDWGEALSRMTDAERNMVEPYALVRGSVHDSLDVIERMRDANPRSASHRLLHHGEVDASEAVIESNRTKEERDVTRDSRIAYALARGKIAEADRQFANAPDSVQAVNSIINQILLSVLPLYDRSENDIVKMQYELEQMDLPARDVPGHEEISEYVESYLQGILAWRAGDRDVLDRSAAFVTEGYERIPEDELLRSVSEELRGLQMWLDGNLDAAIEAFRNARPDGIYFLDYTRLSARGQPPWFLAETLVERGSQADLIEAIDWFSSLPPLFAILGAAQTAPGWERMAQLHDQLGNADEAIRYYGLFADRWKEADPELQPRVEAAIVRVNVLLDQIVREPN
ncbi:MAG: hypothetical protein BMS9Abin05_1740 [Rhodothermia bacterium]|nr:MAG: hypothetical protein BMS9Abin05_1740 [Rhodothermia bacterium]